MSIDPLSLKLNFGNSYESSYVNRTDRTKSNHSISKKSPHFSNYTSPAPKNFETRATQRRSYNTVHNKENSSLNNSILGGKIRTSKQKDEGDDPYKSTYPSIAFTKDFTSHTRKINTFGVPNSDRLNHYPPKPQLREQFQKESDSRGVISSLRQTLQPYIGQSNEWVNTAIGSNSNGVNSTGLKKVISSNDLMDKIGSFRKKQYTTIDTFKKEEIKTGSYSGFIRGHKKTQSNLSGNGDHEHSSSFLTKSTYRPPQVQNASKAYQPIPPALKIAKFTGKTQRTTRQSVGEGRSIQLPIEKAMLSTDPTGCYFQVAKNRNLESQKRPFRGSEKAKSFIQAGVNINDFFLFPCKGQGRFGKVYPAIHKKTNFLLAIKQLKKEALKYMIEQFSQQLKLTLYLSHPNIVKMYGYFHDRENIYVLMEYMEEGSLFGFMKGKKDRKVSNQDASRILKEVCLAVGHLHDQGILHRDIKPQNVVMSNGVSKLCDFGWAVYSNQRRNTYCGTLDYVCPQILQGQSYDSMIDVWSIGVLAYEMIVGKAPFYNISRKQTEKKIMNCEFNCPAEMNIAAKKFITKALRKNTGERHTIQDLLKQDFLKMSVDHDFK